MEKERQGVRRDQSHLPPRPAPVTLGQLLPFGIRKPQPR